MATELQNIKYGGLKQNVRIEITVVMTMEGFPGEREHRGDSWQSIGVGSRMKERKE